MGIMVVSTMISCGLLNAGLFFVVYHVFGIIPTIYLATAWFCASLVLAVRAYEYESSV